MKIDATMNMVHESEAQRQYARVRIPAKLLFTAENSAQYECTLYDLSAGGFRLQMEHAPFAPGSHFTGTLQFTLDEVSLSLPVQFHVRWLHAGSGDIGCEFSMMEPRQVSVLRHLITSFLSGELVTVDDTLNILARDNFTRARKKGTGKGATGFFHQLRSVLMSLVFFSIGLAAFGMVCFKLYDLYFVSHARSARVTAQTLTITMPRDGSLQSVVQENGLVSQGAPLAVFRSSMLDLLKGNLNRENLNLDTIEQLVTRTLKGTITSPCNCRVQDQLVADGQFAARGQAVFRLVDVDTHPFVMAAFSFSRSSRLYPGVMVRISIPGQDRSVSGRIDQVVLPGDPGGVADTVLVRILPEQSLAVALIDRPVEVTVGGLSPAFLSGKVLADTVLAGK